MGLFDLLSGIGITSFGEGFGAFQRSYEWICKIIEWIIWLAKDVGLGIVLFTLALKLITLPLDIFSRASMKKNSIKMEMMKGDLEKLQKQYANNPQLYQQKMSALYKKNGYSAFSACLPTIVTLVFFIIVIGAFNSYSKGADKEVFNTMGVAYSQSIDSSAEKGYLIARTNDGEKTDTYDLALSVVLKGGKIGENEFEDYSDLFTYEGSGDENLNVDIENYSFEIDKFIASSLGEKYSYFFNGGYYSYDNTDLTYTVNREVQFGITSLLSSSDKTALENEGVILKAGDDGYIIADVNAFYNSQKNNENINKYFKEVTSGEGETATTATVINFEKYLSEEEHSVLKAKFEKEANAYISGVAVGDIAKNFRDKVVLAPARQAAKDAYYENRSHSVIFFWVKNLWVTDSPFKSAIPTYSELQTSIGKDSLGTLTEANYNEITYLLEEEKKTGFGSGNGFFVLVVLSILSMLLSTVVMNKTQKTQMQLSSVDGANGTAAASQKMMMWMMPIMFGIFAFFYSASFSIYMITSTLLSMFSTLLINFFVEKSFMKKIEKEAAERSAKQKYGKRRD
ncbi:MAG: YidC/Oxa1 family membrane protein insertase [Clostridia bacterium]|nr:YidC/Oxa1 family membrane protein insertase [Clostridia bacterium]